MSNSKHETSRRGFLRMAAMAGGGVAVHESLVALGMIRPPEAETYRGRPQLRTGTDTSVVILGAGVGGLAAAYELQKAGVRCQILEVSKRSGGRNLTVRRGDVIQQIGHPDQVCGFDEGLYLNAGPGRIPYHHQAMIEYCQELDVALEIYVMESRANRFQTTKAWDGAFQLNRQVANDTRGYIAQYLAEAIQGGCYHDKLDGDQRRELLDLLVEFGKIDPADGFLYKGSQRDGFELPPGILPGVLAKPLEFADLLSSGFWNDGFYQPEDFNWQPTLFQPVGGMDKIVEGFERQVGPSIVHNARVVAVRNHADHVEVVYEDTVLGSRVTVTADYCISNIPLPVLSRIDDDGTFTPRFRDAIGQVPFADTAKVGWQADRRFWEESDVGNQAYGGISWTDHLITQMWYPSNDYFSRKGVLTGAYNFGADARRLAGLDLAARLDEAFEGGRRLHPDGFAASVPKALGLSIAWQQVPHQLGGWADWSAVESARGSDGAVDTYTTLLAGDGRFQICGDQLSQLSGWQEGAVLSAHFVIERILGVQKRALPTVGSVPRTRAVTGVI